MNKLDIISEEQLRSAVETAESTKEALSRLGLSPSTTHYTWVRSKATQWGIVLPTYDRGPVVYKYTLEELLVENSTYAGRQQIKKRLIKQGVLEDKCSECGLLPLWNGKKLTLQLDHINGTNNDHRLENLRILCPNCHTQTPTFCGVKAEKQVVKEACKCGAMRLPKSNSCRPCSNRDNPRNKPKIEWPPLEDLQHMIRESNFVKVGKKLGVSDTAIRKHLVAHNVDYKSLKSTQ